MWRNWRHYWSFNFQNVAVAICCHQVALMWPEIRAGVLLKVFGINKIRELTCERTSWDGQPMHFQQKTESIVSSTKDEVAAGVHRSELNWRAIGVSARQMATFLPFCPHFVPTCQSFLCHVFKQLGCQICPWWEQQTHGWYSNQCTTYVHVSW